MTAIIEAIDSWTSSRYSAYTKKLWGFCELVHKSAGEGRSEQVMPMTIPSNTSARREQVSLDDRYSFITWIRWAQPVSYTNNDDWSFGKSEARTANLPLRLVLAHKRSLGENIVFDFINSFPSKFSVAGYQFVFTDVAPVIDPDHESIYLTELGNTVYEKHRFDWNIYVLNITMQFLECEKLTP